MELLVITEIIIHGQIPLISLGDGCTIFFIRVECPASPALVNTKSSSLVYSAAIVIAHSMIQRGSDSGHVDGIGNLLGRNICAQCVDNVSLVDVFGWWSISAGN